MKFFQFFKELKEDALGKQHQEFALFLTGIFLATYRLSLPLSLSHQDIAVISIGVLFTLFRASRKSATLWGLIALMVASSIIDQPFISRNTNYLLAYWALACCICLMCRPHVASYLKRNAVLLIGLTFAFSFFWKIWYQDYLNGSFFTLSLMTQKRVMHLTSFLTQIPLESIETSLRQFYQFVNETDKSATFTPANIDINKLRIPALALSFWILYLEATIALAFLVPRLQKIRHLRNVLLLLFIFTSYLIIPVDFFGGLLCALGIAQLNDKEDATKWLYVLAFIFVYITTEIDLFQYLAR